MGDPKKFRKKHSRPIHPWNKKNIDEEKILVREYGLVKKKEIYSADLFKKKYMGIAKRLIAETSTQGEKEKKQVLDKLQKLGLISSIAGLDNLLGLELKDILERRLQSIVFRRGLARSMKQARQFIVHRHIIINEKEITSPAYLVSMSEEMAIRFKAKSSLANEEHPERVDTAAKIKEEADKIKELAEKIKAKKSSKKIIDADELGEIDLDVNEEKIEPIEIKPVEDIKE